MKKLQPFLSAPRYLRAIPSLVVLTTAIAWSVAPDTDAADKQQQRAHVMLSQDAGGTSTGSGAGDKPVV